jgi:hypothetical protein
LSALAPVNGLPEHELNLTVYAPELILRPRLEVRPEFGVDAQQEGFTVRHVRLTISCRAFRC